MLVRWLVLAVALTGCISAASFPRTNDGGTCSNGKLDGAETGIDCGGGICGACPVFSGCARAEDCLSFECVDSICVEARCDDGKKSGRESDVDCGGDCLPCPPNRSCFSDFDCAFGSCERGGCMLAQQSFINTSEPRLGDSVELSSNALLATGAANGFVTTFVLGASPTNASYSLRARIHRTSQGGAAAAGTEALFLSQTGSADEAGLVEVFDEPDAVGDTSSPNNTLTRADAGAGALLGAAIAADREASRTRWVVIGAPNLLAGAEHRGQAFLFAYSGRSWSTGTPLLGSVQGVHAGASLAANEDAVLIGAPGAEAVAGEAWLHLFDGSAQIRIQAPEALPNDGFGSHVALAGQSGTSTGLWLVVGAKQAAYVGRLDAGLVNPLRPLPLTSALTASGEALRVSAHGRWLAVAARGRVETFGLVQGVLQPGPVLDGDSTRGFGSAVSVFGERLVVSSPLASPFGSLSIYGVR